MFTVGGLDAPDFSQRLEAFLVAARAQLGVRAIAIAELAAPEGRLVPTWRSVHGELAPERDLELSEFTRLTDRPDTLALDHPDLAAFGGCRGARDTARVVPLELAPRLIGTPDAILFLIGGGALPLERVEALRACLARGLSNDRRTRLLEVVFAAIEQAADAIELSDLDGRLFYVNQAWERFSAYPASEALGLTAAKIFRDPDGPLHDSAFYQFTMSELHAGKHWMGAISGRARDGRRLFYEANVAPFAAAAQGFRGHVAIRRDLAHRSERDAALAQAHHEFRAVLAAIPDGVTVLREGRIYFVNAAFQAIVSESESALIGRAYTDFVHPEDRARFQEAHRVGVMRVRLVPAEGSPRFVEVSTAGEVSFEGKPAMILLSRDTTDYQLAREELSRTEKLSALGTLLAGVAHELNNPLAYVALNLDLLSQNIVPALSQVDREILGEAIEGVKRMREIAGELRTFSGNDGPGPAEAVDVSGGLTSALNIAQNEIRHRARLVRDLEPGLCVLAREGQLVQVLVNVLVNAAQAMDGSSASERLIHVASRSLSSSQAEIVVSDTGPGISEALLPRLFEPFSTTKRRGEGSGLGLAICKRIVQGLGGEIFVESEVGKGTNVRITLPRTERARAAYSRPPKGPHRDSGPAVRVLVVDDEGPIARAVARVLAEHDVTTALDGAAALALLATDSDFDVVLCDLMMPRMSGAELYAKARELRPELAARFAFMTGGAITESSKEFLEGVGSKVLWKPFERTAVVACIEQILRKEGRIRGATRPESPRRATRDAT